MAGDLPDFPDFRSLCIFVHRRLGLMLLCCQDYRFDGVGVMPAPIRDLRQPQRPNTCSPFLTGLTDTAIHFKTEPALKTAKAELVSQTSQFFRAAFCRSIGNEDIFQGRRLGHGHNFRPSCLEHTPGNSSNHQLRHGRDIHLLRDIYRSASNG